MKKKIFSIICIIIFTTFLFTGCQENSQEVIGELNEEVLHLKDIIAEKEQEIGVMQERIHQLQQEGDNGAYVVIYKHKNLGLPKGDWAKEFPDYPFNKDSIQKYINKTTNEMKTIFGEPYLTIQHTDIDREYWVYLPNVGGISEDSTGIYLKFENDKVVDLRIDEFNGIVHEMIEVYLDW